VLLIIKEEGKKIINKNLNYIHSLLSEKKKSGLINDLILVYFVAQLYLFTFILRS
jgi:hypothetical protein